MGWQQAEEAVAKAKGGKFIKLEDTEWIVLSLPFCGKGIDDEPQTADEYWDDKEEKSVPFTAAHKTAGKEPTTKLLFNAYVVKEHGEKEMRAPVDCELKVFQCTTATCKEIFAARDKYGMDMFYEVKRYGVKKKTKYKIMYEGPVTDEHKARIAELAKDKHDLKNLKDDDDDDTKQGSKPKANGASRAATSGATISDAIADELLPLLKAMPDDKRKGFLKEFGIARVRELKMSDVDRARTWIKGDAKPAPKEDDAFT